MKNINKSKMRKNKKAESVFTLSSQLKLGGFSKFVVLLLISSSVLVTTFIRMSESKVISKTDIAIFIIAVAVTSLTPFLFTVTLLTNQYIERRLKTIEDNLNGEDGNFKVSGIYSTDSSSIELMDSNDFMEQELTKTHATNKGKKFKDIKGIFQVNNKRVHDDDSFTEEELSYIYKEEIDIHNQGQRDSTDVNDGYWYDNQYKYNGEDQDRRNNIQQRFYHGLNGYMDYTGYDNFNLNNIDDYMIVTVDRYGKFHYEDMSKDKYQEYMAGTNAQKQDTVYDNNTLYTSVNNDTNIHHQYNSDIGAQKNQAGDRTQNRNDNQNNTQSTKNRRTKNTNKVNNQHLTKEQPNQQFNAQSITNQDIVKLKLIYNFEGTGKKKRHK